MEIRAIEEKDMHEWAQLVSQLSPQASLGDSWEFNAWCDLTRIQNKAIFVVVEDEKIIGTASVLLETKVNRGFPSMVAHVEEVVIDKEHRGRGIGKLVMDKCVEFAKDMNCYKLILDCSEDNVEFYEKCGFERYEVCMRMSLS